MIGMGNTSFVCFKLNIWKILLRGRDALREDVHIQTACFNTISILGDIIQAGRKTELEPFRPLRPYQEVLARFIQQISLISFKIRQKSKVSLDFPLLYGD